MINESIAITMSTGEKIMIDTRELRESLTQLDLENMLMSVEKPFIIFRLKNNKSKLLVKSHIVSIVYSLPERKEVN